MAMGTVLPRDRAPWSLAAACIAVAVCAWLTWQWRLLGENGNAWERVIRGDAIGYYSYLPALLVHGDLDHDGGGANYMNGTPQGRVRKYPVGVALMELPLFLVGDAYQRLTGQPRTGYEEAYHVAVAVGGVLSLLFGLFALRRLLLDMGFSDGSAAATLAILCAGTSLVYNAVISSAFSHGWSFMAVALFLLSVRRAFSGRSLRWLIAAGMWFGIALLLRPVNALILLTAPLVIGGWPFVARDRATQPSLRHWALASVACLAVVALQPVMWKAQTGHWWVWSYAEEGFHWGRPEILQVLFGPMKGLFFWWPALLLVIPGTWLLLHRSRTEGLLFVLYFALLIYITSAWWSWFYGDGYGLRPILDHLPVFALVIGRVFDDIPRTWRKALAAALVPLCALQCFHIWQFEKGIIHPHSMDLRKYGAIFLRTDTRWRGALGGNYEMAQYAPLGYDTLYYGALDLSNVSPPWQGGDVRDGADRLGQDHPFGATFHLEHEAIPEGRRLFVTAEVTRTEPTPGSSAEARIVCEIGKRIRYEFKLNDLPTPPAQPTETWRYAFPMAAALPGEDFKLYVWQPGTGALSITRFNVCLKAVRNTPSS